MVNKNVLSCLLKDGKEVNAVMLVGRITSNDLTVAVFAGECCSDVFRFDGWVVCEEHRDSLVYAWEEEQAIAQQKELDVCLAVFCIVLEFVVISVTYLLTVVLPV